MENVVLVRQIGNGTAFQPDATNTSFTLFNDRLLVDCGYNVFGRLLELGIADKIDVVFITHTHDDHIGSLGSFLYYREFVVQKPIVVIGSTRVFEYLKLVLQGFSRIRYPNGLEQLKYVRPIVVSSATKFEYHSPDRTNYRVVVSSRDIFSHSFDDNFPTTMYSFFFYEFHKEHSKENEELEGLGLSPSYKMIPVAKVVITGDTKANPEIEQFSFEPFPEIRQDHTAGLIVFHDFSKLNNIQIPHAVDKDYSDVYSDKFKKYVVKVHTGEEEFKEVYRVKDLRKFEFADFRLKGLPEKVNIKRL